MIPARRFADALAQAAVSASPPERREWAEAMRAEVDHLPDSDAAAFAAGCLWTAVRARVDSAGFVLGAARWGLVLAAILWAGLHLRLAGRMSAADAALPEALSYAAAAIYALGALATALFGLRVTAVLATPVLGLTAIYAAAAATLMPQSPNRAFYQALAVEEVAVLLAALLIALVAPRWAAARTVAAAAKP